jgi:hypothetical protein
MRVAPVRSTAPAAVREARRVLQPRSRTVVAPEDRAIVRRCAAMETSTVRRMETPHAVPRMVVRLESPAMPMTARVAARHRPAPAVLRTAAPSGVREAARTSEGVRDQARVAVSASTRSWHSEAEPHRQSGRWHLRAAATSPGSFPDPWGRLRRSRWAHDSTELAGTAHAPVVVRTVVATQPEAVRVARRYGVIATMAAGLMMRPPLRTSA